MKKSRLNLLFITAFATLCLVLNPLPSEAANKGISKPSETTKERLVLMPLRVGDEIQNMQGAMETAIAEGLQQQYTVFAGEDVAKKTREIFKKESAKKNCDETRCMENIAIAFQSELIAVANVTKIEGGYLLAINIRNVMDNKSMACKGCDAFLVVERLKELTGTTPQAAPRINAIPPTDHALESPESLLVGDPADPENSLWAGVKGANSIEDYETYLNQYPNGRYVAIARSLINKLQATAADQAWQIANKAGGESDYQNYLNKYPEGRYVELAKIKFNKLKTEREAAEAAGYISYGGLTWMPYHTEWLNWSEADSYCTNTTLIGKTGWRLPTKDELNELYISGVAKNKGWSIALAWTSTPYNSRGHYGVGSKTYDFIDTYNDVNPFRVTCVHQN